MKEKNDIPPEISPWGTPADLLTFVYGKTNVGV